MLIKFDMRKISIKEEYGVNDLGDIESVNKIIDKIDIQGSPNITINLRHCLVDYPATSKLIDNIIFQLSKISGRKELVLILDIYFPEATILNLLLLGSVYFNIEIKKEIPIVEMLDIINNKIKEDEILISIDILNRIGDNVKSLQYGK